ncbi:MAG: hypothetical protein LBL04_02860 [Bacteroidales bacterium]|jgi:hypothetical protein|nr:hypothetical protein [Bacteroidales bacterium]
MKTLNTHHLHDVACANDFGAVHLSSGISKTITSNSIAHWNKGVLPYSKFVPHGSASHLAPVDGTKVWFSRRPVPNETPVIYILEGERYGQDIFSCMTEMDKHKIAYPNLIC